MLRGLRHSATCGTKEQHSDYLDADCGRDTRYMTGFGFGWKTAELLRTSSQGWLRDNPAGSI
jgi:hypothetical protein